MKHDSDDHNTEPPEPLDLSAWEPQLPPDDFADRLMSRLETASRPPAKVVSFRRRAAWGGAAVATFAAAAALLVGLRAPSSGAGAAIAKDRIEVAIGSRGVAVLEPGASVEWKGDDVTQAKGDVFYRVERGASFRVHTPAGDVEVKGTCFAVKVRADEKDANMQKRDLKSGFIGSALTGLAFVAVYEGKVAVSHAAERADLAAGETAQLGPNGVAKGADEKAFLTAAKPSDAAGDDGDPAMSANRRLAHQVGEYRSRLDSVTAQKADLEQKLKRSEESLAATQGGPPASKPAFEFSQDDWREMAKTGTMKYRSPCFKGKGEAPWSLTPDDLSTLGLSPQDGATIQKAYATAAQHAWDTLKPLCAKVIGSPEAAEKIGADSCSHLVLDDHKSHASNGKDDNPNARSIKAVAEMRAGDRPLPGPTDEVDPATKVFLTMTGTMKEFEEQLTQSFGPEEAHRIAFADEICAGRSEFRTSSGKKPPPVPTP